jgi:alkylhydroperoxidase/carboxymuconolactone decarboxylase family protein YurZ
MNTMTDRFAEHRMAMVAALLHGPGATPAELRQAIAAGQAPADLAPLIEKIRAHAYRVTDGDVDTLRNRYTEDQLFEIIVSAAFGAAEERLTAGLRALEEAAEEEKEP